MDGRGVINRNGTVFVMVDVQERMLNAIDGPEALLANCRRLVDASKILGIPLLVTEQYPKGLGSTVGGITLPEGTKAMEKLSFSCLGCDGFAEALERTGRKTIVLFGIEAHICILKTALDALEKGYEVHVAADATASRSPHNRELGIERMRQSGAFIASTEIVLFQLMDAAGTDEFKKISQLVK